MALWAGRELGAMYQEADDLPAFEPVTKFNGSSTT